MAQSTGNVTHAYAVEILVHQKISRPYRISTELAVLRKLGGFGRTLGPDVLAASAGGKVMEAEDGPEKICDIAATAR